MISNCKTNRWEWLFWSIYQKYLGELIFLNDILTEWLGFVQLCGKYSLRVSLKFLFFQDFFISFRDSINFSCHFHFCILVDVLFTNIKTEDLTAIFNKLKNITKRVEALYWLRQIRQISHYLPRVERLTTNRYIYINQVLMNQQKQFEKFSVFPKKYSHNCKADQKNTKIYIYTSQ